MTIFYVLAVLVGVFAGFLFYSRLSKKYGEFLENKEKYKEETKLLIAFKKTARFLNEILPITRTNSEDYLKQLQSSGIKFDPTTWHGIVVILSLVGVFFSALLFLSNLNSTFLAKVAYIVIPITVAWGAPRFILSNAKAKRKKRIESSLPYVLDILTITVVAGMPINSAFKEISEIYNGDLGDEFGFVFRDINFLSYSREKALNRMANRCDVRAITTFVGALVQSEKQGTPIAKILIGQSVIARKVNKSRLEEKANKISTKMLIPLVIFFIPAIFIVTVVPIGFNILNSFKSIV